MEIETKYNLHNSVIEKLDYFIKTNKIPHIIFYGPTGSGKNLCLIL